MITEDGRRRLGRGRRSQRPPVAARGGAPRRPRAARLLRRPRARTVALVAVVLALLGGAWLWVRDSSLVAVHRVTVTGISGPDSGQIRGALTAAASNMTTLDVRMNDLRTAVAPYPVVKALQVSTQFPHGMRIKVVEEIPVGAIVVGGRSIPVAGDGTLLHDVVATGSLPSIPVRALPGGSSVTDAQARGAVAVLAAAPYQMLAHISQVTSVATHGLVAQIRAGPSIYFGDTTRLQAKWSATAEVLADPGSAGAAYIDVTDPRRPVGRHRRQRRHEHVGSELGA